MTKQNKDVIIKTVKREQTSEGEKKMKEERLYELAREALLSKWGREHDFLKEHPENEISQIKEKELWSELIQLEEEMNAKGF